MHVHHFSCNILNQEVESLIPNLPYITTYLTRKWTMFIQHHVILQVGTSLLEYHAGWNIIWYITRYYSGKVEDHILSSYYIFAPKGVTYWSMKWGRTIPCSNPSGGKKHWVISFTLPKPWWQSYQHLCVLAGGSCYPMKLVEVRPS